MIREFADRWPRTAAAVIYLGGYLAGGLLGALVSRLLSWRSHTGTVLCFGASCGALALAWAQRSGLAMPPEDMNRPTTLFGSQPVPRRGPDPPGYTSGVNDSPG